MARSPEPLPGRLILPAVDMTMNILHSVQPSFLVKSILLRITEIVVVGRDLWVPLKQQCSEQGQLAAVHIQVSLSSGPCF